MFGGDTSTYMQLKEEGLVTFSKKSIPGNREIILNQEESSIKKIYQELKRISIKEKIMNYLHPGCKCCQAQEIPIRLFHLLVSIVI
mgnify:CR=1 FL=1